MYNYNRIAVPTYLLIRELESVTWVVQQSAGLFFSFDLYVMTSHRGCKTAAPRIKFDSELSRMQLSNMRCTAWMQNRASLVYTQAFFRIANSIATGKMAATTTSDLLLLSTIITLVSAGHLIEYNGPGPSWARNRTRAVSSDGPIANELGQEDAAREAVVSLIAHFERIGKEMVRLRRMTYAKTAFENLCDVNDNSVPWYKLSSRLGPYGFLPFRSSCITDLSIGEPKRILEEIKNLSEVLQRKGNQIIERSGVEWENAFYFSNFTYITFAQNCSLHYVPAVRVHSSWALFTSLTRYDRANSTKEARSRPYLDELISAANERLFNLPVHAQVTKKHGENETTVESLWNGAPLPTIFGVLPNYHKKDLGKNPAIEAALASSSKWLEQVQSSYNAANIATMTLSCIVAFIPLSFFHEAKLHGVFFYVLFTDIFTCAPLAVKGIELIDFSAQLHQAVRTRVYGLDGSLDLGVAEVFAASCSAPKNVYWTGVKFVIFGVLGMVVGIALEVMMLRRVKTKKERKRNLALADQTWAKNTACTACLCTHSLLNEGTRGLYATKMFLFRIPSRKQPPYDLENGWSGVLSI